MTYERAVLVLSFTPRPESYICDSLNIAPQSPCLYWVRCRIERDFSEIERSARDKSHDCILMHVCIDKSAT